MGNFIKPFAVAMVYLNCRLFNASISGGSLNPTIAFSQWVWNLGAYNDKISTTEGSPTVYEAMYLGRFVWIYIGCPLFAGAIAGAGYRSWERQFLESMGEEPKRQKSTTILEQAMNGGYSKPRYDEDSSHHQSDSSPY